MKERCSLKSHEAYDRYGGRGIKVCKRWNNSFENFLADMGARPSPEHSIDRIRSSGNYTPSNCRWATRVEQARNRITNRHLTFRGERRIVAEWAERVGLSRGAIYQRLKAGWATEKALTTPIRQVQRPTKGQVRRAGTPRGSATPSA